MKNYLSFVYLRIFAFIICILLLPAAEINSQPTSRLVLNMNTDWAFYRGDVKNGEALLLDDSRWIPSTIPHTMQLEKKHCGGDIIYDGIGWYRRYFSVDESYKGKKVFVSFEGIMTSCRVYLNEQEVAQHHGGYVGFTVDLTDKINFGGNNLLAVRVSAEYDPLTPPGKPQKGLDFYYYSGIYRDVCLFFTDPLHITEAVNGNTTEAGGVFVSYPQVNKEQAVVEVSAQLNNGYARNRQATITAVLTDNKKRMVATQSTVVDIKPNTNQSVKQQLIVQNPKLWHPYTPNLYTLKLQVKIENQIVDEVINQIGIRTIQYTTDEGFFINGEKLYLRGANRHQAYPYIGDAAPNSVQEREVIDMKRGGYNAVRAAHYPHDPAFLDACDKHGLLVIECIPGWQYFNKDTTFVNRIYEVGRDMIRRDRNHPAIILWETALNESRYPVEVAKNLQTIAHKEYPGNQMYTAGDYFGHTDMVDCYDVFYKQVARFPKDGDVMSNYPEDQLAVKPLLTREWGDGVGQKPRVCITENEEELVKQCKTRYEHLEGNGYFDWCMLDANKRNGGHFLWSYNDYTRGSQDETMYCGVVDVNRYPKFSYYMLQSMRSKDIDQKGLYTGPMVFIASYNTAASTASAWREVTVFSNCDEVKLYRNNRLVGKQTRNERALLRPHTTAKGGSPDFVFNLDTYESGELKAEAFVNGKRAATHRVSTPGKPHHLEIVIHTNNVKPVADGSDMIPVYVKVCDEKGTLVNTSSAMVNFSISGQGEIVGQDIERIGVSKQQVEGGIGFIFVRTTKQAGKMVIKAQSPNLESGSATISTMACTERHVPDGKHAKFTGKEEDGVILKLNTQEARLLSLPVLKINTTEATSSQSMYPTANLTDGNDRSWWIADTDLLPQTITLSLAKPSVIKASRILFQKDSSSYKHKVEISEDGIAWTLAYERECTGWDFKPMEMNYKNIKFFRITITGVSEGRAGLGEVTLFGE